MRLKCLTSYAKLLELQFICCVSLFLSHRLRVFHLCCLCKWMSSERAHAIASQPEYCVLFRRLFCVVKIERERKKKKSFGIELIDEWKERHLSHEFQRALELCAPKILTPIPNIPNIWLSFTTKYKQCCCVYTSSFVVYSVTSKIGCVRMLFVGVRMSSSTCFDFHPASQPFTELKSHSSPFCADTKRHWIQATDEQRISSEAWLSKMERLMVRVC